MTRNELRVRVGPVTGGPAPSDRATLDRMRDRFSSEQETDALAADPVAQQEIVEAEVAHVAGDFVTAEELRAWFGLPPLGA
jgi:hypothetical protein